LQRAARAALALLALALPFELVKPVGRIGPLQLTSAEVFLYVALALSAAAIAVEVLPDWKRLPWRRIAAHHGGVALFAIVLLLSAARAPIGRPDAIKFALRNVGGVALYVAAANILRTPAGALTSALTMAIGAVVAASLMWAEFHLPGASAALVPFHAASFDVFGLPRASGPFQYPNIAAMYLEGVLAIVLVSGAALDARRGQGAKVGKAWSIVALALALVLVEALALTASRAGMLAAGAVLVAVGLHAVIRKTPARWQAPAALAVLGVVAVLSTTAGSLAGLRLKFWNDDVWYRSVITPAGTIPDAIAPATDTTVDIDVRNTGVRLWPASGPKPVTLSYHWRDDATGRMAVFDGVRTHLPHDIAPGAAIRLPARIRAPAETGRYRLHLELVHEEITWFGQQGDPGYDAIVEVRGQAAPTTPRPAPAPLAIAEAPTERVSRTMLWRAAVMTWREHPLLGIGPDNFRHTYNRFLGLSRPDERLHANNLYFETLASLGLAGVLALALVIAGFVGATRRALRQHGAASVAGLIAVAAAAGLGAYLVHGLFDYFLEFTPTYALFWLLAGMLAGLASDPRHPHRAGVLE
jgi:hypothetical protein